MQPSTINYQDIKQLKFNANLKNRAQSVQNFRLNSTSEIPTGSVVKQGLDNFIKQSNIDVDELSNNLSNRQKGRRASSAVSRSRSDQSRKVAKHGPGLPLPKNAYKRLAETYRREADARKNKVAEMMETPESKSRKEVSRQIEQPKILQQNQNEQTFENVRKFIGDDKSPQRTTGRNGAHGESPNFFDPDRLQEANTRPNKFVIEFQNVQQSEGKKRFNSHRESVQKLPNADLLAAPAGSIVRLSQQNKLPVRSNYSTFGDNPRQQKKGQNVQSMSPLKNLTQFIEGTQRAPRPQSFISDGTKAAGKILRQGDVISRISNASQKNQSFERLGIQTQNQSHIVHGESTIEPSIIL